MYVQMVVEVKRTWGMGISQTLGRPIAALPERCHHNQVVINKAGSQNILVCCKIGPHL